MNKALILLLILAPSVTLAAGPSLELEASGRNFAVGERILASIVLRDSRENPVNAVESTLMYPEDLLKVLSISKQDSALTLWAVEPAHDKIKGTISFAGGSTQAIKAARAHLLKISFEVKTIGQAKLSFSDTRILAADGKGTDVTKPSLETTWIFSPAVPKLPTITPVVKPTSELPLKATTTPQVKGPPEIELAEEPTPPIVLTLSISLWMLKALSLCVFGLIALVLAHLIKALRARSRSGTSRFKIRSRK